MGPRVAHAQGREGTSTRCDTYTPRVALHQAACAVEPRVAHALGVYGAGPYSIQPRVAHAPGKGGGG